MNIAIFGAGAIGSYLAARLAVEGSITLIARAGTARKIVKFGLCVEEEEMPMLRIFPEDGGFAVTTAVRARESGTSFDALLITTKSQQLLPALPEIKPLIAPHTLIACLQNGIPWWYFQGLDGRPIACLDPENALPAVLPARQLLGGVVHKSVDRLRPGHALARRAAGDRFIFGSPLPDGDAPKGEAAFLEALRAAGLPVQKSRDIRRDVWQKLLGNAALNPISALANARIDEIVDFAPTYALSVAVIRETMNIAAAYHVRLDVSPEERLARSRAVGAARSSMLQDKIRRRPLETEGILGGLIELARRANVPAPRLETLYAVTALLSRSGGR
ncbi:MAG: 2-dehydropantoate 2-reductase [Zoogloeaceae bacterium]|jgi:2-dehydropantoate 2-reductase|nr:2-dehydropantoate 2-reductase [Zoogloeaceae bacterium]